MILSLIEVRLIGPMGIYLVDYIRGKMLLSGHMVNAKLPEQKDVLEIYMGSGKKLVSTCQALYPREVAKKLEHDFGGDLTVPVVAFDVGFEVNEKDFFRSPLTGQHIVEERQNNVVVVKGSTRQGTERLVRDKTRSY